MIIELHAIQTFAPSNLNRDDTGNPKEALFGGVRRARISSQAAKRALRVSQLFKDAVAVPTGTRTKKLVIELADQLEQTGIEREWAEKHLLTIATGLYAKMDRRSQHETSVLLYISDDEKLAISNFLQDAKNNDSEPAAAAFVKDMLKQLANRTSAPDIALFGRMLAEKPALNIDAACQVAHAISTHEVNTAEFDYFTAVDDLTPQDDSGAGMLGLVAYNSATYYRCVRIDWEQLVNNLGGDSQLARQTIGAFMQAFALVVPSGMKNSFLNQHAPDFLLAVARPNNDGQSLANAFEKPVKTGKDSGFVQPSIDALCKYWDQVEAAFRLAQPTIAVLNPRAYAHASDELAAARVANLRGWIAVIDAALSEV